MRQILLKLIFLYKRISKVFRETRLPIFVYTDCKFYPSCSDYAVEAINRYGVVKGSAKSAVRVLRCSPFSKGGIDNP